MLAPSLHGSGQKGSKGSAIRGERMDVLCTVLLIRKLNRVRIKDGARFDEARLGCLVSILNRAADAEFAIAILGALRYVGTMAELPVIDRIGRGHATRIPRVDRDRVANVALFTAATLRIRLARETIEQRYPAPEPEA
jgi:hypothetical protein